MENETDYRRTLDIRELTPKLRNDVECSLAGYGTERCYIVEDLSSGRFFRIGFSEYALISLFDGRTTLGDAVSQTATALKDAALTENEATVICKWLMDSGLAVMEGESSTADTGPKRGTMQRQRWLQAANPMTPRFALFNPDRLLQSLRFFGTLFCSWLFAAIWLYVIICGAYFLWVDFDIVVGNASLRAISPHDIVIFAITWCLLKFLHESGHALACHRLGGRVVEAGVMFILLIPLPYVDVTSSWRIRSRRKRIFIAAAGMYLELFVAGIAACVLHSTQDPVVTQVCRYVIISASITTVLFNANPLMKFDGYYILSDFLNLPNLAMHAQQLLLWVLTRLFFGAGKRRVTLPEKSETTLFIYGVLAALWRILIVVSLSAGAALLLRGAGIVLAALFVLSAVGMALFKFGRCFAAQLKERPTSCVRCVFLASLLIIAAWSAGQLPLHKSLEAPAVVDYRPITDVRSRVRGFVAQIHVNDGDQVQPNQLLITLTDPELDAEIERLTLQVRQSEARARRFRIRSELASAQIEQRNIEAMTSRLIDLKQQKQDQRIRAVAGGTIIEANLSSIEGRLVVPGQKLLSVGDRKQLVVHGMIPQHYAEEFRGYQGQDVLVHIHGTGTGWDEFCLETLSPRAQTKLSHAAFSAQHGGDITVVYTPQTQDNGEQEIQAAEPHFPAYAAIPNSHKEQLHAGQRATIAIRQQSGTIVSTTMRWCKRMYFDYLVTRQRV